MRTRLGNPLHMYCEREHGLRLPPALWGLRPPGSRMTPFGEPVFFGAKLENGECHADNSVVWFAAPPKGSGGQRYRLFDF